MFIGSEYYFDGVCEELGKQTSKFLSNDEKFDVMRYIQSKGPDIVIFTFGEYGSLGIYGNNSFTQPAMKVEVKDTTGAGDVFHGAFNVAYLEGKSVPEAARFATAVSTIKCTQSGGRSGIASRKCVDEYIKTGKINFDEINNRVNKYQHGLL